MSPEFELTRREFLEVSAGMIAALIDLQSRIELTHEERATVLAVLRDLFPHPGAPPGAYYRAVAALNERCLEDTATLYEITRGTVTLERCCSGDYAKASESSRIALLTMLKDDRFFRIVYAEGMEAMYGSREAWSIFVADSKLP